MKKLIYSIILLSLSFSSMAQEEDVEKISVIGSRIKRTDIEGPSPILVIDREQIERSGYSSLGDNLRDIPILEVTRESALSDFDSLTEVTIRGSAALVLVNGQRISPVGGSRAVDINLIPLSAIERVDILKDGASSVYGADAVGGVINIITKRNYSGGQINIQGNLVQRKEGNSLLSLGSFFDFWDWERQDWSGKGDDLKVDGSYGWNANNINYLVGGQLRFNAPMYMRDRSFGRAKKKDFSGSSGWGTWRTVTQNGDTYEFGDWNPSTHCPQENIRGQYCVYDFTEVMQFGPQILQGSAFFQTETDIGDTSLFSTAIYSYTKTYSILAPPPDSFALPSFPGDKSYLIPASVASSYWGLPVGDTQNVELIYRLVHEPGAGPRRRFSDAHFYQLQSRANHPFGETMDLEIDLNVSGSHSLQDNKNYFDKGKLFTMATETNQFNPMASVDKKSDISSAAYEPWKRTHSFLVNVEPKLTGEFAEINDRPFYFAAGLKGGWQMYSQSIDPITLEPGRQWGGGSRSEGEGHRWYSAVFGEISHNPHDTLEVQLATRTDFYSDFGLTRYDLKIPFTESNFPLWTSPQLRFTFQPIDELKFRGSWSMGFRAPTLENLYQDETLGHPFGVDKVRCPQPDKNKPECERKQHKAFIRSNEDLQPEIYQSFNVGAILEPVENFSMSLDYYRIDEKDKIVTLSPEEIFRLEQEKGAEGVEKMGLTVNRVNGKVETEGHIVVKPTNSAYEKKRGIELTTDLLIDNLGIPWDITFTLEHNYWLYVETKATDQSVTRTRIPYPPWVRDLFGFEDPDPDRNLEVADPSGTPKDQRQVTNKTHPGFPRWNNRATLGFLSKDKKYAFYLTAHNIPPQLKKDDLKPKDADNNPVDYMTSHYFQLDLTGIFALSEKSNLMVGIKNIWDAERPYNDEQFEEAGYIDSSLYSIEGRTIDVRYSYNF